MLNSYLSLRRGVRIPPTRDFRLNEKRSVLGARSQKENGLSSTSNVQTITYEITARPRGGQWQRDKQDDQSELSSITFEIAVHDSLSRMNSGQQCLDDVAVDIGQSVVAALVAIGQLLVVDAQKV